MMAFRNIYVKGDDILRKKAKEVKEITPRIITLLEDMKDTMEKENGVGIAAPQVGVSRRVCIVAPSEDRFIEMINPVILEADGEQVGIEGCLSVPDVVGQVTRPQKVVVEYQNRNGEKIKEEFLDFEAVVVSHEIDHLEGVLYTDKAVNIQGVEI